MFRLIASILAGVLVAFAIVIAADALCSILSAGPMPADANDPGAMAAYVAAQPVWLLMVMVASWTLAALAGAALASRLARAVWPGWAVTGLFLLATGFNFLTIPHPAWMIASAVVLILAAGWLGSRRRT
jgi:hypothetical protein